MHREYKQQEDNSDRNYLAPPIVQFYSSNLVFSLLTLFEVQQWEMLQIDAQKLKCPVIPLWASDFQNLLHL